MRRVLIVPLLMVIVALGLGYVMIPRGQELAFMELKASRYEEARLQLEKQSRAGELTAATVKSLVDIYLAEGNVDLAIQLVEEFVRARPKSLEARELLGQLYRDAMRPGDYQRNLEAIYVLAPSESILRELAQSYAFYGQEDQLVKTLQALVDFHGGQARDAIPLAQLLASQGQPEQAADVLLRLQKHQRTALDPETRSWLLSLLLDLGRPEEALAHARSWLREDGSLQSMDDIASGFAVRGRPDLAVQLLEPFVRDPNTAKSARCVLVDQLIGAGQFSRARQELQAWHGQGGLSDQEFPQFLQLALRANADDLALAELREHDTSLVPVESLPAVVTLARRRGDEDLQKRLAGQTHGEALDANPLVAAKLAVNRGDSLRARFWLDRVVSQGQSQLADQIATVRLCLQLERPAQARTLMAQIVPSAGTHEEDLEGLADLYIKVGLTQEGFRIFDEFRHSRTDDTVFLGWVQLALASGRVDKVAALLNPPEALSQQRLEAVYYLAQDMQIASIELPCAQELFRRDPSVGQRLQLANALAAANRFPEALTHARALVESGHSEADALYVQALQEVGAKAELGTYWLKKLRSRHLSAQREDELLSALLEMGVDCSRLPQLRQRARQKGGSWLFAYAEPTTEPAGMKERIEFLGEELLREDLSDAALEDRLVLLSRLSSRAAIDALEGLVKRDPGRWGEEYMETLGKSGQQQKLKAFMVSRLNDPGLSEKDRRDLAYRLLAAGDVESAESAFQALAAKGGPHSTDLQQLLYLWGPRPEAPKLQWLEDRAVAASGQDRVDWLQQLLLCGAADRVVALTMKQGRTPDPLALPVTIAALDRLDRRPELQAQLPRAIKSCQDAATLRSYAEIAEKHGLSSDAESAWRGLLASAPTDNEALLRLGSLALQRGHYAEAETLASKGLADAPNRYEFPYCYAEALVGLRHRDEAGGYYRRALELIRATREPTHTMLLAEANILARLGLVTESCALFERLLQQQPEDNAARADYAALLLEVGSPKRAREVLNLD